MKIININRQRIDSNSKNNTKLPVISTREGANGTPTYSDQLAILDSQGVEVARIIYNGDQLNCGARLWIETSNEVKYLDSENNIIGGYSFAESK